MKPTTAQLDATLTEIMNDAPNIRAQIKVASRVESEFYARTYLWWRDASQQASYLEANYKAHQIKYQPRKDGVDWIPLLKLVTGHCISEGDLVYWPAALDAIDADFNRSPAHYSNDPIQKIVYFVKSKGGKTAFKGYHKKSKQKREFDSSPSPNATMLLDLPDQACAPAFLAEAIAYYSSSKAHALPNGATAWISDTGFGLLAARQGEIGLEAVELGNSLPMIDQVLVMAYRANFDVLPPTMRSVVEPLHILNVPHAVAMTFDDFVENAILQDHEGKNKQGKPQKRFIYRPETQDFLLSYGQLEASVVVVAKPKTKVIDRKVGDLFLPAYVRTVVEMRLLYQRFFNMFSPSQDAQFKMTPDDELRQCIVSLTPKKAIMDLIVQGDLREETARAYVSNIRHPPLSFMPFVHDHKDVWQVGFNEKTFQATWRGSVSVEWLRNATAVFFERWIVAYGVKSRRRINKIMSVVLTEVAVKLNYEFGTEQVWGASKVIPVVPGSAKGKARITVRCTDFAFVLRQIADLNVTDSIVIEANAEAVVITFATTGLSYRVHMPAADAFGERSAKCFQRYEPIRSAPIRGHDDDDDGDEQYE